MNKKPQIFICEQKNVLKMKVMNLAYLNIWKTVMQF